MKRALVACALVGILLSLGMTGAGATSPSPCPSAASDTRTGCPPATPTNPNQAAYNLLESRLGGDIARALEAEQKLNATLDSFAATESLLNAEVADEEAVIADLEDQIA